MPDFIIYLIKANLAILFFYAGYHFLLRRLTFYTLNRYYFLFALVFSVGYPLVDMDDLWAQHTPIPPEALMTISNWHELPETPSTAWPYVQALLLLVAGILGIRFLFRLASLRQIHLKSAPSVWKSYRYFHMASDISPFSFWRSIYLHLPRHPEHELKDIFEHEQVHVDQLHSIDVLLVELCKLLFWFNPFTWLMRHSLCENLEFIADREVLRKGIDSKAYQYNLLKNLTQNTPQLGSSFTFKSLKNRIIMMNKKRSSQLQLGKYLLLIPAVILLLAVVTFSRANKPTNPPSMPAVVEGKAITANPTPRSDQSSVKINEDKKQIISIKEPSRERVVTGTIPPSKTKRNDLKVRIDKTVGKEPLLIVDGLPHEYGKISALDPNKIESISVLKDSKAEALYGDKGKNGVIIVTTRRGF